MSTRGKLHAQLSQTGEQEQTIDTLYTVASLFALNEFKSWELVNELYKSSKRFYETLVKSLKHMVELIGYFEKCDIEKISVLMIGIHTAFLSLLKDTHTQIQQLQMAMKQGIKDSKEGDDVLLGVMYTVRVLTDTKFLSLITKNQIALKDNYELVNLLLNGDYSNQGLFFPSNSKESILKTYTTYVVTFDQHVLQEILADTILLPMMLIGEAYGHKNVFTEPNVDTMTPNRQRVEKDKTKARTRTRLLATRTIPFKLKYMRSPAAMSWMSIANTAYSDIVAMVRKVNSNILGVNNVFSICQPCEVQGDKFVCTGQACKCDNGNKQRSVDHLDVSDRKKASLELSPC